VQYKTIRNVPLLKEIPDVNSNEKFILYQGAVNEGRGFEWLIPAMKLVDCKLVICGDGNYMSKLKKLIEENKLEDKIVLKGMLPPEKLPDIAIKTRAGVAIAENTGLNQWLALPNKFFDYIHYGLPQVTMNYPEYRKINDEFEVAILINSTEPEEIAKAINNLLTDDVLYQKLRNNCLAARKIYCWQNEEKKLLSFYKSVFES
jgi:glycosyltransferase involved in cell wall biosynthesis